jgi:tRNA-modifying protein YgfZ
MPIVLPPPQLLEIAGPEAIAFAHAQFSGDVRALAAGAWQWNAWLNPQGRVRAFFQLLRIDEETLIAILRGGDASYLAAELQRYVFRSKVKLRPIANARAIGYLDRAELEKHIGRPVLDEMITTTDDGFIVPVTGAPVRWLLVETTATAAFAAADSIDPWTLAEIRAGLIELAPDLADKYLPQWLGLDRLGAVSVRKGCYPGQEIMSRLHFKGGTTKRSLYRVSLAGDHLPPPGASLLGGANPAPVGAIISASKTETGAIEALASIADAAASGVLSLEVAAPAEIRVLEHFV